MVNFQSILLLATLNINTSVKRSGCTAGAAGLATPSLSSYQSLLYAPAPESMIQQCCWLNKAFKAILELKDIQT